MIERRLGLEDNHCWYHGTVEGDLESVVAVSTCGGIIRGRIKAHDEHFFIVILFPLHHSNTKHTPVKILALLRRTHTSRVWSLLCIFILFGLQSFPRITTRIWQTRSFSRNIKSSRIIQHRPITPSINRASYSRTSKRPSTPTT